MDPKEIMEAFSQVKEGLIAEYHRYHLAERSEGFKQQVQAELNLLSPDQRSNEAVCSDLLERLLTTFVGNATSLMENGA